MSYVSIALAISAALIVVIAYVWFVRMAFGQNFLWGLGVLIVPPLALVLLVYKWPLGRGPLIATSMGGFMLLVFYPDAKDHLEELRSVSKASMISLPIGTPSVITGEYLEKRRLRLKDAEASLIEQKKKVASTDSNAIRRLTLQIEDYNKALAEHQRLTREYQTSLANPAGSGGWTLDLANIQFAPSSAAGKVKKQAFAPTQTLIEGNNLVFKDFSNADTPREVLIVLDSKNVEDLQGRAYSISPSLSYKVPEVQIRNKKARNEFPTSEVWKSGYAMRLEFSSIQKGQISGRIYLCIPDEDKSILAGTFQASIQR